MDEKELPDPHKIAWNLSNCISDEDRVDLIIHFTRYNEVIKELRSQVKELKETLELSRIS